MHCSAHTYPGFTTHSSTIRFRTWIESCNTTDMRVEGISDAKPDGRHPHGLYSPIRERFLREAGRNSTLFDVSTSCSLTGRCVCGNVSWTFEALGLARGCCIFFGAVASCCTWIGLTCYRTRKCTRVRGCTMCPRPSQTWQNELSGSWTTQVASRQFDTTQKSTRKSICHSFLCCAFFQISCLQLLSVPSNA